MKISKETLALFKNYAGISSNLLLKAGNKLTTIAAQRTVLAESVVQETFPTSFGIYDLNEFLGILSLFAEPELNFSEKYVTISEGTNTIKYYAADENVLVLPPEKALNFPDSDIEFVLTANVLQTVMKSSSVLRSQNISVVGDGTYVYLQVGDKKNATANTYSTVVADTDKVFSANFKVDNLKIMSGEYNVSISSKQIAKFKSTTQELTYYIAVEADSTF